MHERRVRLMGDQPGMRDRSLLTPLDRVASKRPATLVLELYDHTRWTVKGTIQDALVGTGSAVVLVALGYGLSRIIS